MAFLRHFVCWAEQAGELRGAADSHEYFTIAGYFHYMKQTLHFLTALLLAGCHKSDPAPTTGELEIHVDYPKDYLYVTYSLFTETGYYNLSTGVTPLVRKNIVPLPGKAAGRESTVTPFTGLNAGNYVLVFGATPFAVQVVSGQHTVLYETVP